MKLYSSPRTRTEDARVKIGKNMEKKIEDFNPSPDGIILATL